MPYDRYDDADPGACYSCYATWLPGEPERHRPGCERLAVPSGLLQPGQCPECGTLPTVDNLARGISFGPGYPCPNEGACSRWADLADHQPPDDELVSVAPAARRTVADDAALDDLPF